MNIRVVIPADVPSIQRLNRELDKHHADLLSNGFRSPIENARPDDIIRNWIDEDDADYLVAEVNGRITGFVNIRKAAHPLYSMFQPHEYALIENAVVERAMRGRRLGTQLFNAVIDWALAKDLSYVQTTVWSANTGTREFYLRQGFEPMTEKLGLNLRYRKTE